MKKWLKIITAMFLVMLVATPAMAVYQDMWAVVYLKDSTKGEVSPVKATANITFEVLQRNSDTRETLYYPNKNSMTSLTNPVTTTNFEDNTICNDLVAFRVDPGETNDRYVDLRVIDTTSGFSAFVEDFDKFTHTVVIDRTPGILHHTAVWYDDTTTNEYDTGIDFLYDTQILCVAHEVVTKQSSGTINVGTYSTETDGDADCFLINAVLSGGGFPAQSLTYTGASLDNGTNFYQNGAMLTSPHAKSLTYTMNTTTGTARGYIHIWMTRMR